MQSWQLQQAKAHLSDLVREASAGKPQEITLRGKPTVVVLSMELYKKLIKPKPNLVDFLRQSPLIDVNLEITRDKSGMRDIDL
ncbi:MULTISPECIES: type II toxin-antitoxin system Phd/YefM family antitoxin [unclassified Legionella]|uniref:type II toxin-antitoxin system Phd/YefM family antitoxin n=1 Tax=unclassified Legionella TaxID=2622702 RepID=UPI001E581945|nr:type II toxin-antitoxin system Phd/YefM family antitoxin [Legionella sp. 31fI33]MCC5014261.1 type II toxin-antitoxin system Phd/YefM family antitoxin [Legionella sp. 31fI33]